MTEFVVRVKLELQFSWESHGHESTDSPLRKIAGPQLNECMKSLVMAHFKYCTGRGFIMLVVVPILCCLDNHCNK